MKPLHKIRVLDLTQRLPGPLATYHLQNLGADVTRVEAPSKEDPFKSSELKKISPLFFEWYQNFNSQKKIVQLELSELSHALLDPFDLLITTMSLEKIKKFQLESLSSNIILIKSDEEGNAMHDLNALARLGILSLFVSGHQEEILNPPFLPIAGLSFSYEIALNALASLIGDKKGPKYIQINLIESLQKGLSPLLPSSDISSQKQLHSGLFPCYNLYRLKDGNYVALAAIEEHYFKKFCEDFKLHLPHEARFDTTGKVAKKLSEIFKTFTYEDLLTKASQNYCMSLVKTP